MLSKSIQDFYHAHQDEFAGIDVKDGKQLVQIEHVFSAEIEPWKQSYIERNFHPPLLFRDIRELGNEQAYTAYGALVDVPAQPGCVDLLVAGTSCVDYSNLNNEKVSRVSMLCYPDTTVCHGAAFAS
jgi:site-specific DNA-cytosine methylase